ncbi:MAG: aldehyde dehydrogenase family protein [Verrucomicrobia bacterium]|nr:aldehyde dehydrogenase family protein [Verrucomicrobiota bacterium]
MKTQHELLIGGKWQTAVSGKRFQTRNPATGEVIAEVAEGDATDIDRAVAAARKALDGPWGRTDPSERGKYLRRMADLIRKNAEELALLDTRDCGKPITDTRTVDVPVAAEFFDYFAGLPDKICGSTVPVGDGFLNYTLREPVGVVGQITAWNFPILNAAIKLAPALACGNTLVLKPAEDTPLSALELGRLSQEAGLPDGVVNIVPGYGPTAGEALVRHPGVDKIAFTGSTEIGKHIMRVAADTVKHVTLELGGKSPNIVFPDADLDAAVAGALFGIFLNQGQVCCAGSRLFLHETIYDKFMEKLLAKAKSLRVGNPMDEKTQLGALVSAKQLKRVGDYVESGKAEGAKLEIGGARPKDSKLDKGCFFTPTVFTRVKRDMRIAREEIFGPVSCVMTFKDEDEAVSLANDTTYGLAAAVWTRDISRAHIMARRLKAGVLWINVTTHFSWATPYGGYKESGFGREMGLEAIGIYTQAKDVWVNLSREPNPWCN